MILSRSLPTIFAKNMAIGVDLYSVGDKDEEWEDLHDKLVTFQQISATADYETALTAYLGHKLTEDQQTVLKVIHKTTKPWLMGHVFGELMEKLNSNMNQGKDVAAIAELLLENFAKDGEIDSKTKKSLLVRFAQIPAGEEVKKPEAETEDE